jgi:hypothetical protein
MMSYRIFVYLHVLGAFGLFVALGVEAALLVALSRARAVEQLGQALTALRVNRLLGPMSALLLLVPGLYMARSVWSSNPPWLVLSFATFLGVMALGAVVTGRRVVAFERALTANAGAGAPAPTAALRVSFFARLGLLIGVTYLMVVKPELGGCIVALLVGSVVGVLIALSVRRGARDSEVMRAAG